MMVRRLRRTRGKTRAFYLFNGGLVHMYVEGVPVFPTLS